MAVFRFSAQVIGRSSGRTSTGAAAYRAAATIRDERTGLEHDYTRKAGVLHTEIMAPANAPVWMTDRAQLWNAVERVEKRKDAQLCREILLSLPAELDDRQRQELVRAFVAAEFVARGMVADLAIHAPHRQGDDRNHHAHVMLTMRSLTADGFAGKDRAWNDKALLERWREAWALYQNRALERAGKSERVDHRSLEAQGIDREPEPKQGPVATTMERQGRASNAGADREAVKDRNAERDRLRQQWQAITAELSRPAEMDRPAQAERARDDRHTPAAAVADAFEIWANEQRAILQNVRLDAEGSLGRNQQRARDALEDRLEAFYGPGLDNSRKELEAIAGRLNGQKRGVSGLIYRLTGARRDREQAEVLQAGIANAEQRQAEQRKGLAERHEEDRAALAADFSRMAEALEVEIGRGPPDWAADGQNAMLDDQRELWTDAELRAFDTEPQRADRGFGLDGGR